MHWRHRQTTDRRKTTYYDNNRTLHCNGLKMIKIDQETQNKVAHFSGSRYILAPNWDTRRIQNIILNTCVWQRDRPVQPHPPESPEDPSRQGRGANVGHAAAAAASAAVTAVTAVPMSLPIVGPIVKRIRHKAPDQRVMIINESPEESSTYAFLAVCKRCVLSLGARGSGFPHV